MDANDVQRAIWRMAHEIVERNHGIDRVVLVGLQTGGVPLANRLADALEQIEEERPDVFTMRVGNILPGERVTVALTLVGPLSYEDGEATYRLPLVVAPRYIPGTPTGSAVGDGYGSPAHLARRLFTDYLVPFEITSVLLLVAIVGAVVLGKRRI